MRCSLSLLSSRSNSKFALAGNIDDESAGGISVHNVVVRDSEMPVYTIFWVI